jgi:hypothetical protein
MWPRPCVTFPNIFIFIARSCGLVFPSILKVLRYCEKSADTNLASDTASLTFLIPEPSYEVKVFTQHWRFVLYRYQHTASICRVLRTFIHVVSVLCRIGPSTSILHVCLLGFRLIECSKLPSPTWTLNLDLYYRNVSQDLSESILTMVGNCSILLTKPRQPPPGVLRHRGIEPAFNPSSLGGQVKYTSVANNVPHLYIMHRLWINPFHHTLQLFSSTHWSPLYFSPFVLSLVLQEFW